MREKSSKQNTLQRSNQDSKQAPAAGKDGATIAPPIYGVDILDRGFPIQRKLMVGEENTPYEREADQISRQVLGTSGGTVSRINPLVQRTGAGGAFVPGSDFESRLSTQRGGGHPLRGETRSFMESRFGTDFSDVRVHTDATAAQLSRDVQAQAFTHGKDIYMGAGKYSPHSMAGKQLLAHELTHTVQQTGQIQRDPEPVLPEQINTEDIEYEIIGHRLAYQSSISSDMGDWLDSRGYQRQWAERIDTNDGFAVGLLLPKAGSGRRAILAFKGTSPSKTGDVLADLDPVAIGYSAFKKYQRHVGYLVWRGMRAHDSQKVDVTGHSLGGALAQHAAAAFPAHVQRVVTFQAPGIGYGQAQAFNGTQDVTHHIATGDVVDLAGGQHLAGKFVLHKLVGLGGNSPTTHMQYLLNSDALRVQRDRLGLTDRQLAQLGVADKKASHSGEMTKTQSYPFRMRQIAAETVRTLVGLCVKGVTASLGFGAEGVRSSWQRGGSMADTAWQATRSWGRDQQGNNKSGVGNALMRVGGNIIGGIGVLSGRALGGVGSLLLAALSLAGTLVSSLSLLGIILAGLILLVLYGLGLLVKWIGGGLVRLLKFALMQLWRGTKWAVSGIVDGMVGASG